MVVCLDSARFLLQNGDKRISGVLLESPEASVPMVRSGIPVVMGLPHGVMQTVTIDLPLWLTPTQRWTELSVRATAALAPAPDGLPWVLDACALAANADGYSWLVGAVAQSTVDQAWLRLQGLVPPVGMGLPDLMHGGWSVMRLAVLPPNTPASLAGGPLGRLMDVGISVPKHKTPWWHARRQTAAAGGLDAACQQMNFLPYRVKARQAYRRQSLVALAIYAVALTLGGGGVIWNRLEASAARDVLSAAIAVRAAAQQRDARVQDAQAQKQRNAALERAAQRLKSMWRAQAIDAVLQAPADTITYHRVDTTLDGINVSGVANDLAAVSRLLNRLGEQLNSDTVARVVHLAALPANGIRSVRFEVNLKHRVDEGTADGF